MGPLSFDPSLNLSQGEKEAYFHLRQMVSVSPRSGRCHPYKVRPPSTEFWAQIIADTPQAIDTSLQR